MDGAKLIESWEWHLASFSRSPNDDDRRACDSIAIAICDLTMEKKPSPKRLLEMALSRQSVDLKNGPEHGPDSEVVLDRLLHAAWHRLSQPDYQVVRTDGDPFFFYSINDDGVIVRVSEAWASLLGYEPEELLGRKSIEFLTERSLADATDKYLPAFFRDGHIEDIRYDYVAKDGSVVPVTMSATAEFSDDGKVKRSLAVLTPA